MATVHAAPSPSSLDYRTIAPIFQGGLLSADPILAVTPPLVAAITGVVGSAALRVAGTTSGNLEFDIEYWNGSTWASIFSTLPTIAYGNLTVSFTPNITVFPAGTRFRAEITGLSGGATEEDLSIQLVGIP
jgi:hypothetical protein